MPDGLSSESDCLYLADRILTMIQQECEKPDQSTPSTPSSAADNPSSDEAETDQADNSPDSDDDGHSEQDEGSTQSPQDDDKPSDASDDDSETGKPDHREILEALLTAGDGDFEQDVFEAIKSALALESDSVSEYVMPVGTEPPTDERAGLQLFQKVQGKSGKIRAALQGLVQAHNLSRSRPGCSGRLDGKRLHRLRFGEAKVFQRNTVKPAPNTAMHLLLDKSESMGYRVFDTQGQPLGTRMPIALEATLAHAEAAKKAVYIWNNAMPAPANHPYLIKKSISTRGARLGRDNMLIIPLYNSGRELVNLQFISETGGKRFLSGGQKKCCFYSLGSVTNKILICEGFATGASLFESSGLLTVVAFDAGNLKEVAITIKGIYPGSDIVICGDNDESGVGQKKAIEAALAIGGKYIIPATPGHDWNDSLNI